MHCIQIKEIITLMSAQRVIEAHGGRDARTEIQIGKKKKRIFCQNSEKKNISRSFIPDNRKMNLQLAFPRQTIAELSQPHYTNIGTTRYYDQ